MVITMKARINAHFDYKIGEEEVKGTDYFDVTVSGNTRSDIEKQLKVFTDDIELNHPDHMYYASDWEFLYDRKFKKEVSQ
jgi:hypothetical protein